MEKNKSSSSSSSVCNKIRGALSSNPALRAIHRISSFNQQPKPHVTNGSNSNPPSSTTSSTHDQTKLPHTETLSGAIPVNFENGGNSSVAKGASKTLVGNSERATKGMHSGKQGKESNSTDDITNDTFKEFILRVKNKIRTVSNIDQGQISYPAAPPDHVHEVHHGTTKNENHEDPFKEFIHRAKKKIRTTTIVGKTGSLRRE